MIIFRENSQYLVQDSRGRGAFVYGNKVENFLRAACEDWAETLVSSDPYSNPRYAFDACMEERDFGDIASVWEIYEGHDAYAIGERMTFERIM